MRTSWAVAAAGLLCAVAAPAEAQQTHQLDLPAGSLQQSVLALGRQARISIAITDPALRRLRVPRVRGRMSVEQALARMLAGSRATFLSLGGSSYRIVSAPVRRVSLRPPPPPRAIIVEQPPSGQPTELPEIVVTASKRNVLLRDYPGPAVVIGGDLLDAGAAAAGTEAIAERVPSLGSTHLGPGRDKLFIRSIADSSFSGQTQATVGQYFGEARVNYNAPDPDLRLYDVGSVELLPGPQGTLYGAGAMGGVLRIVPNAPDARGSAAAITASAASTAHGGLSGELAGMVNLPIAAGRAAVRLVAYGLSDAGYIDDVGRGKQDVNRTRIRGGRATGLIELGSDWSIEAGGVFQSIDGRDGQYADRALPDLTRRTFVAQPFSNHYALAHATLAGRIDEVRITSTLSASVQELLEDFDISTQEDDQTLFRQRNRLSLLSGETRASHTASDGSGWLAGAHVLRNRSQLDRSSGWPGALDPLLGARNRIDERTLFGEYTRRLTRAISLTGGVRLSHMSFRGTAERSEALSQNEPPSAGGSEWRLLPAVAVGVEPGRDLALYLRYQESFRPGGLIVRSEATQELEGDHIAAWEGGLRFGQKRSARASGAIALSYARWTNVQSDMLDTVGLPSTINIGDGDIISLEGRLIWRATPELTFNLAGTVNRSEVTNPNPGIIMVVDAPLPNVPDVAARFGVDYQRSLGSVGDVRLSAWANHVGKSSLGIGPILGREQGDFLDTGLEARLTRGRSFVFLRATNLLDKVGNRFALGSVFTIVSEDQITPLRPRTVRIGVHSSF